MTLYDDIHDQLEDKTIDVAQLAAIGKSSQFGLEYVDLGGGRYLRRLTPYATMDDGQKRPISRHDYEVLDGYLDRLADYWRNRQPAESKA